MTIVRAVEEGTESLDVPKHEPDPFKMKQCASLLVSASEQNESAIADASKLIAEAKGHIHGVGIGKSGYIARLFSSTLQTIGISASFLHASDALHGEAGSVSNGNLAVIFSHSGSTSEILALVEVFEQRSVPVISIVGDASSPLAVRSQFALITGVPQVLELRSMVPTTSTVVATSIAMGLVSAVSEAVGLDESAFRESHPAGRLGWDLTRLISEVMRPIESLPVVPTSGTLDDAATVVARVNASACSIQDEHGNVHGILGREQIERKLSLEKSLIDLEKFDPTPSVSATISIHQARLKIESMDDGEPAIVRDGNKPVGFFFASDLHPSNSYH